MKMSSKDPYADTWTPPAGDRFRSIDPDKMYNLITVINLKTRDIQHLLDAIDVLHNDFGLEDNNERLFNHMMSIIMAAKRLAAECKGATDDII